jgi:hypothetical protein
MANKDYTKVLDTITPENFNTYMQNISEAKSRFIQSGIAVADPRVSTMITSGNTVVTMPYWNDLADTGSEVVGDGDVEIGTDKITAGADMAAVTYRAKGWSVNEMAAVLSGDDPMKALMNRIGDWWLRDEQHMLISIMNGIFAGALKDTHVLDRVGKGLDAKTILDTKQLLGDSADRVTMIGMHSAVFTELQKLQLIEYIQPATTNIAIPTYLGYRVFYDDGIAPDEDGVYTSYLFGTGSIGRETGTPSNLTTFETDRKKGFGTDVIYTRQAKVMHPRGVKWTNESVTGDVGGSALTASNIDFANPENWKLVYEPKSVGLLAVKHSLTTPSA